MNAPDVPLLLAGYEPTVQRRLVLEGDAALPVLKALASELRQQMLGLLSDQPLNVTEIASAMGIPHSTTSFHLNQLQAAGLIHADIDAGTRGAQKRCTRRFDELTICSPGVRHQGRPGEAAHTPTLSRCDPNPSVQCDQAGG